MCLVVCVGMIEVIQQVNQVRLPSGELGLWGVNNEWVKKMYIIII